MKYLTTAEVADLIRETPENVARRCASGQIAAARIGGSWRIGEDAVAEFMEPKNTRRSPRSRSTAGRRPGRGAA